MHSISKSCQELGLTSLTKLLFSKLIHKFEKATPALQRELMHKVFAFVGDPAHENKWSSAEFSDPEDIQLVKEAREKMKFWLTQEFISVFFQQAISAPDRKEFWLKYAKHISDFRVFGNSILYQRLKNIQSISSVIAGRYSTTNVRNKSAIAFIIQGYKIVEFGNDGDAAYFFSDEHPHNPLAMRGINDVSELKGNFDGLLPPVIVKMQGGYIDSYNKTGRLLHMVNENHILTWQEKADFWFRKVLNIKV